MLERIKSDTLASVVQRKSKVTLDALKQAAVPTTRSFAKALQNNRASLIFECKKASPSEGLIRPNFDIAEIVKAYDPFVDAISVITNATFFEGHLSFLKEARAHTQKPLLCKDFILTEYQVYEARVHDADAILLMLSLLNDEDFKRCFRAAQSLNMDVLAEVQDEGELDRALALGARIIGVNNRDFRTLNVELRTAERVLPKIPKDKIAVLASGISNHQQILDYRNVAHAFLVGTSLMKQPDLPRAVRELAFGRVKVCGLTRKEDAEVAHACGATFGGLIFTPVSLRFVDLERARTIRAGSELSFVGVFMNQPIDQVVAYASELNLAAVQLHANETQSYVRELRAQLPASTEIWKAVHVQNEIPQVSDLGCDRIFLDAYSKDMRGGTGQRFDWNTIKDLDRGKYILSGGLSPANAREADEKRMWALDVNSGVETAPGIKSEEKLRAFFQELR